MIICREFASSNPYGVWNYSGGQWSEVQGESFFATQKINPLQLQRSVQRLFFEAQEYFENRLKKKCDGEKIAKHVKTYRPLCKRLLKKLSLNPDDPAVVSLCPRKIKKIRENLDDLADKIQLLVCEKLSEADPSDALPEFDSRFANPLIGGERSSIHFLEMQHHISILHILSEKAQEIKELAQRYFEAAVNWAKLKYSTLQGNITTSPFPANSDNSLQAVSSEESKKTPPTKKTSRHSLSPAMLEALEAKDKIEGVLKALWQEFGSLSFLESLLHKNITFQQPSADTLDLQKKQIADAQEYHDIVSGNGAKWQEALNPNTEKTLHDAASKSQRYPFFDHARSIDLISSHLVYLAPLYEEYLESKETLPSFKVIQPDGHISSYQCTNVFNLWRGVLCCSFEPEEGHRGFPILTFRGTQKNMGLPGFLGSIASVCHRFGPGANILNHKTDGMKDLEDWLKNKKDVILSGHSLGGNIALDLFSRYSEKFSEVLTFGSPGRNDRLYDRLLLLLDEGKVNDECSYAVKVHQFVHARDPLSHIGSSWLGNQYLIDYDESYEPESFIKAIEQFHAKPLLFREKLVIWKMGKQANLIPGFLWMKFTHRFLGYLVSGPLMLTVYNLEQVYYLADYLLEKAGLEPERKWLKGVYSQWLG